MKGKVLEFDSTSRSGVISGDDGNRYTFSVAQWKSTILPKAGSRVDFSANNGAAEAIYLESVSLTGNSKKIPALLLAFFLGAFGAHKFYLGYTKQAMIMLLVFLFGWILLGIPSFIIGIIAFVEFIIYLTKSEEDFEQTYVVGKKGWF
ncbi:TM2 domain-containing protein [Pseudomonas sp. GM55]|jgi:TM2 domain-containing membrane protein YozV|uniref:TM2 domain-containing protein n=1 Tax=Pseudomonas sp. GM55 TaxID=1144333 RepID=UPI0002709771|nr:TM2 domain-containing protein [Pseudomonas sp. GM55]EJM74309.1 putative membrane protein [Pseudomonas sp. GM55]